MAEPTRIKLFEGLSAKDMKEITPYLFPVGFKKKETVFSEGDPSDWLYIVVEGRVKITKVSHEGKEIILEIIEPGDFFGGIAVLRGFPYPANAVAMEDANLLKVSKANLLRILDRFPPVMNFMAQNIGDRMKDFQENLKNIALERVEMRIASLLLKLAERTGGGGIDIRLTKQDIADMVGTTVETAIRTMSRFRKLGLIEEKKGRIAIKDPEGLASRSGHRPARPY